MRARLDFKEQSGWPVEVYESVLDGDNATAALAKRVCEVLAGKRGGIVTDVDGTISPIVARPEEAFVLPKARQALAALRDQIQLVAVVSGRSVADARQMVGVEGLTYVGNHGLEMWRDGRAETLAEAQPWVPRMRAVVDEITRQLAAGPTEYVIDNGEEEGYSDAAERLSGVIIENKGASASLHYRLAPDPAQTRRALLELLASRAVTTGIRIVEGRMVINLLPPLSISKGSAVTWLAREYQLRSIVYLGDDVTDAHAFRALKVLRRSDSLQTLAIGVVGDETPPSVRRLADATLPSVAAVADLLWEVSEALKSSDTMKPTAPTVGSE